MIYTDAFILYEYHGNNEFWVWWWSTRFKVTTSAYGTIEDTQA
jgi:hypothetical protein